MSTATFRPATLHVAELAADAGNDSENAAMLHINETLGYDRRLGFVSLIKRVET